MKTLLISAIMLCLLAAFASARGDLANQALDSDMIKTQSGDFFPLDIGGFDPQTGQHSANFFLGNPVYLRFSDVPYNVRCNDARFVVEIYQPNGQAQVLRSAPFRIDGWPNPNQLKEGQVLAYNPQMIGRYDMTEYIYCYDGALFKQNNPEYTNGACFGESPLPSNSYRVSCVNPEKDRDLFFVTQQNPICNNVGAVFESGCDSDNNLREVYQTSDCTAASRLIQDCEAQCIDGRCVGEEEYRAEVESKTGTQYGGSVTQSPSSSGESSGNNLLIPFTIALSVVVLLFIIWKR